MDGLRRSIARQSRLIVALSLLLALSATAAAQPPLTKQTVAYREIDGHRILADVYRPQSDHVCPVIVWIHGGALIMGHREGIHPEIRQLAQQQQCALVSIDYRLAPETKLPELISDLEAAFEWLGNDGAEQFHLDPQRMVVVGGSAGGYLTLVTGYRVQPQPKALVALYGYGDLTGDWYATPSPHPRHNPRPISQAEASQQTDGRIISDARQRSGDGSLLYLHYRQQGTWPQQVSGFDPATLAQQIADYEPLKNVTQQYPPTLLIHGTEDTDVPYQQSVMMVRKLEEHGVAVALKSIDGGEHGFGGGDPDQISNAYQTMHEFIIKHLTAP